MAPVRRQRPRPRRSLSWLARPLASIAVSCCATVGAVLALLPTTVTASLRDGDVQVGSMVLEETGSTPGSGARMYGGAASYALIERGDGSARAAAAWVAPGGRAASGVCDLRRDGARLLEDCSFTGSQGSITCVDVLDPAQGSVWQRTYADGARVTIAVAPDGAAIPVPFPIGR